MAQRAPERSIYAGIAIAIIVTAAAIALLTVLW